MICLKNVDVELNLGFNQIKANDYKVIRTSNRSLESGLWRKLSFLWDWLDLVSWLALKLTLTKSQITICLKLRNFNIPGWKVLSCYHCCNFGQMFGMAQFCSEHDSAGLAYLLPPPHPVWWVRKSRIDLGFYKDWRRLETSAKREKT